ncbi:MAG: hypothetical protein NC421_05930 [Lachnospiraceae bacterium]|nr:hypothetical protein [Lachnospiraceae bacterium]
MIKRIFLYATMLLSLAACSDDEKYSVDPVIGSDGSITFTITVPDAEKVVSRVNRDGTTNENRVEKLTLLVLQNGTVKQRASYSTDDWTEAGADIKLTVKLDKELRGASNIKFYLVANAEVGTEATTEDAINTMKQSGTITTPLAMSASVESLASLATDKVMLRRNVAKITVTNKVDTPTSSPSQLWGAAASGTLTAGATNALTDTPETTTMSGETVSNGDDTYSPIYAYPTRNLNDKPFVIIKAPFNGEYYYYPILFKNTDGAMLDLRANHWYEVIVGEVKAAGFDTDEEAARNWHDVLVDATIYDHAPEVYDMISDGIRELGVTDVIEYDGQADDSGFSEKILTVKYYSPIASEMEKAPKVEAMEEWIELSEPTITNGDDSDTPGKIATYKIKFKTSQALGALEGAIRTSWRGLDRETSVKWNRPFNGNDVSTVKLTIINGGTNATISDYWKFLAGEGTGTAISGEAPTLLGISPDKMCGIKRNEGFHFPVMYGPDGNRWSYKYDVTMTTLTDEDDFDWSIRFSPNSDAVISNNVKFSTTGGVHTKGQSDVTFTLTCDGAAPGYTYGVGQMILEIAPRNKTAEKIQKRYLFNLYHTGFFHFDSNQYGYRKDQHATAYYYYEVLPIDGPQGVRYILDRNLGATAAGMYIQKLDGTSHITGAPSTAFGPGNESAGGYYAVARYYKNDYRDPDMYDTSSNRLSPPGYRVPSQAAWNSIRNSAKFVTKQETTNNVSYFTSYYLTKVTESGITRTDTIYFPKSRYMEGNNPNGDANTGYYWTMTPAAGTEKEEIGKWLKSLQLNGSTSTYINGNVVNHYMSVRCINDIKDDNKINVTSFNVSGATHVFLYHGEVSDDNYMSNWPGVPIGNYSTMENGWFNFVYESANYAAKDLKAIFNFVDRSGKIITISKNNGSGLKDSEGWQAEELLHKWVKCDRNAKTVTTTTDRPD